MITTLIGAFCLMFLVGMLIGCKMEDTYWARHGGPYKTSVYHKGEFFYVVPEAEYVDMQRSSTHPQPWQANANLNARLEICYRALERIASERWAVGDDCSELAAEALDHAGMKWDWKA